MAIGPDIADATGDAFGHTIGGMFDIPEQNIVEQIEKAFTIADTGNLNTSPDTDIFDPLAGILG